MTMDAIQLKDGGQILFDATFLPPDIADRYFVELREHCQWEQKPGIFGHMQPRLIASYGDPVITYKYSGIVNVALPWTLHFRQKLHSRRGRSVPCGDDGRGAALRQSCGNDNIPVIGSFDSCVQADHIVDQRSEFPQVQSAGQSRQKLFPQHFSGYC